MRQDEALKEDRIKQEGRPEAPGRPSGIQKLGVAKPVKRMTKWQRRRNNRSEDGRGGLCPGEKHKHNPKKFSVG